MSPPAESPGLPCEDGAINGSGTDERADALRMITPFDARHPQAGDRVELEIDMLGRPANTIA